MKAISTATLLVVMLTAGLGYADTSFFSAQFCNAEVPTGGNAYAYGEGMTFYDTPINCPGAWQTSSTNGQANAYFAITSATAFVAKASYQHPYCWVNQVNWDGSLYTSDSRYACSTTGGCTSSDSFSGITQLNWTNPINSGTSYYTLNASISCTGYGHIYQYNLSGM